MTPADERPHRPGAAELWGECWYLDFARSDGTGGFVALALYPNLGPAWWWAVLVTPGGLVAVRDHEVPPPRTGLEVRAEGLWADLVCETPFEHWSVALEAFGVGFDDPLEAWGGERGERLPVGLDLEWETLGPPAPGPLPGPPAGEAGDGPPAGEAGDGPPAGEAGDGPPAGAGGYLQPGSVHGEILVGAGRIAFEGHGHRAHRWGVADWWSGVPRSWAGLVVPGGASRSWETIQAGFDAGGLPLRATYQLDGEPGEAAVLGVAPVLVTAPGGRTARLARALCRFDGPAGGAAGWAEWLLRS